MQHSLSIDTEEYYHATNLEAILDRTSWDSLPSRVETSIDQLLDLFNQHNARITFFILGMVAERHPAMVKRIAKAGHEIASHGYDHKLVYNQSENEFFEDIHKTKQILEDLSGASVIGYRASNFSITARCPWAHNALKKAGYRYDSSVYPVYHPRYSNQDKPRQAYEVVTERGSLFVFPLAVASATILGKEFRFPVAGGAYWRLLPFPYILWGLKRIASKDNFPFNCYFHPWEIDSNQPYYNNLPLRTRIRHYGGIKSLPQKVDKILSTFEFAPIREIGTNIFGSRFLEE